MEVLRGGVISLLLLLLILPVIRCLQIQDTQLLDNLICNYSMKALSHHRTGNVVKVHLPSELNGMRVSAKKMRSATLRHNGVNSSTFVIPPKTTVYPFAKRVAVVYQNLGNWSAHYYNVTGYNMISPVIGILAYNVSNGGVVNDSLSLVGGPISVRFPLIDVKKLKETPKCVKFLNGGLAYFSSMMENNTCMWEGGGHFSLVVRMHSYSKVSQRTLLVVYLSCGIFILALLAVIGVTCAQLRKKHYEEREGLKPSWVRGTKIASASMTRTRPTLESHEFP